MADWAIMVIAIVAITTFARIYAAKNGIVHGRKGRRWEPVQTDNKDNERLRLEVSQLKERLHTLERIATDKSRRLSDEIDSLGRD